MKGYNLIIMCPASVIKAIEYYLNSVEFKDDQQVEVIGFTPRLAGIDQGSFEVQVKERNATDEPEG